MSKDDFLDILNNNYDEEIELTYHNTVTNDFISARFCPVEHGKEYCDATYTDTRKSLFFRLNRPIYRGIAFDVIDELESLLKIGTVSYKQSCFTDSFFEKREEYSRKYKERVKKVAENRTRKVFKKGVYVIKAGRYVKIGVTTNLASRLSTMQTSSAETFELICFFNGGSYELESKMHKMFNKHRIRGEWFNSKIINKVINLHSEYSK